MAASPAYAIGLFCVAYGSVPPQAQHEPTVPFTVSTMTFDDLSAACSTPNGGGTVGCARTPRDGKPWAIMISTDLVGTDDYDCVLKYEKAHLPPNCWGDPRFERSDALAFFKTFCP